MPDNHPRTQLCSMIQQYSQSIIDDPKRCKSMLSDLAPQHRLEINLLITALEQKIAQELLSPSVLIPINLQLEQLTQHLQDTVGIQEELAYWAVESWALALNVIQEPVLKSSSELLTNEVVSRRISTKFIVTNGIVKDTQTGLTWCRDPLPPLKWEDALHAAELHGFNGQEGYKGFSGYTDWRLPKIDELKTLINRVIGKPGNYIDTDIFNNPIIPKYSFGFWSSSSNFFGGKAWIVDFTDGRVLLCDKCWTSFSRLVRNAPPESE